MGVIPFESEDHSSIPAARLFKALVVESDNLLPEVLPHIVKGVEVVQGDGGPGTIKKITFVGDGKETCVKHRIEEVDKVNLKTRYSIIEGDILGDQVEKVSYDLTYISSPSGGSICKSIIKVYTKVDVDIPVEQFKANIKPVEDYLLAHPDVCN